MDELRALLECTSAGTGGFVVSNDLVYTDILGVLKQLRQERETKGGMAIVEVLARASKLMTEQNMPNNDGSLTAPEIVDITGLSEHRVSKDLKTCLRSGEIEWIQTRRMYFGVLKRAISYRIPIDKNAEV